MLTRPTSLKVVVIWKCMDFERIPRSSGHGVSESKTNDFARVNGSFYPKQQGSLDKSFFALISCTIYRSGPTLFQYSSSNSLNILLPSQRLVSWLATWAQTWRVVVLSYRTRKEMIEISRPPSQGYCWWTVVRGCFIVWSSEEAQDLSNKIWIKDERVICIWKAYKSVSQAYYAWRSFLPHGSRRILPGWACESVTYFGFCPPRG